MDDLEYTLSDEDRELLNQFLIAPTEDEEQDRMIAVLSGNGHLFELSAEEKYWLEINKNKNKGTENGTTNKSECS